MSNDDFLAEIMMVYKRFDELTPFFNFEVRSLEGRLLLRSASFQQYSGIERNVDSYGLPANLDYYDPEISLREEREVILTKVIKHAINVNYFEGEIQPYLTSKYPLVNISTGSVVGVLVVFQKLLINSLQHLLLRAINAYNKVSLVNFEHLKLTKREKQLIFLFINGLSSKEIALILSNLEGKAVAKSTIDNIFMNQLRVKFNAHSRESLYDRLIEFGFDNMIPSDLLIGIKIPLQSLTTY